MTTKINAFLANLFPSVNKDQGVVAVSYPTPKGWPRERWVPQGPSPSSSLYYFPTTLHADNPRARRLRARATDFRFTFVIVLDDVGTKVGKMRLIGKRPTPTYTLETSPGNEQWGYRLKEPVPVDVANAFIASLVAAGLTDSGRPNGAGQVMRVPGSLNTKYDPPFPAQLIEWNDVAYTLDELRHGLGFDLVEHKPAASQAAPSLADGEVDPVFDWLRDNGMVEGEADARGWVPIQCPWGDEHTSEGGGTDYFPGSPGAFKCLHAHCKDRTTATLKEWIASQDPQVDLSVLPATLVDSVGASLDAIMHPVEDMTLLERLTRSIRNVPLGPMVLPDCDMTARGIPQLSQGVSAVRVETVMGLIGAKARYNAMTGVMELSITRSDIGYNSIEDKSNAGIDTIIHACLRTRMKGAAHIIEAIYNVAKTNEYHPAEDWITSVPWDGTDRFEALCATLVLRDPKHEPWKRVALRNWCIQAVAAIRNYKRPPQDVGYVLTLQGGQGIGKSRWVSSLMPQGFVTTGLSLNLTSNERDAVRRATRTPIAELGELDASFRRSDQSALKNFLTTREDTYRDAYGRTETAKPRCTVYAATVNPEGFLLDQTGDRRFWPLAVEQCLYGHKIDMQQLWAQAAHLEAKKTPFWLSAAEEKLHAAACQDHYVDSDVGYIMEDIRHRALVFPENTKTWVHARAKELVAHYGFPPRMATWTDLNSALKNWGAKRATVNGKRGWYVPPYETMLSEAQMKGFKVVK